MRRYYHLTPSYRLLKGGIRRIGPWLFSILLMGWYFLQPKAVWAGENIYLLHQNVSSIFSDQTVAGGEAWPEDNSSYTQTTIPTFGISADIPDGPGGRYYGLYMGAPLFGLRIIPGVFYAHLDETVRQEHYYILTGRRFGRFRWGVGGMYNRESFQANFNQSSFQRWGGFATFAVRLLGDASRRGQRTASFVWNVFSETTYLHSFQTAEMTGNSLVIIRAGSEALWKAHTIKLGVSSHFTQGRQPQLFGRYTFHADSQLEFQIEYDQFLGYGQGAFVYRVSSFNLGYGRREFTSSGRNVFHLATHIPKQKTSRAKEEEPDLGKRTKTANDSNKKIPRKSPYAFVSFSLLLRWGLPPRQALALSRLKDQPAMFEQYLSQLPDREFNLVSSNLERIYTRKKR